MYGFTLNRQLKDEAQHYERDIQRKVVLNAEHRRPKDATLPFEFVIKMPSPDQGKRGYSKDFAKTLKV